jgi:hypothetical protein
MSSERYQLVDQKQISHTFICETCGGWWHISLRHYHDAANTNQDGLLETSVRTACACTPEVDPYKEINLKGEPPMVDPTRKYRGD